MYNKEPIAVIGMACRFPGGANSPEEFWQLLENGKDAITEIGNDRWPHDYYYHPDPGVPGKTYAKYAGQLTNVWGFEPEFFGLSPRETIQMDPQQRLLLELTWEALEEAGQVPSALSGTDVSVFVGISSTDHANARFDDPSLADSYFMTGNTLSIAANRISHIFNLRGQSIAIDTACSSFAVALHKACSSIWHGESPSAIVGTSHLLLSPFPFIGFSKASMLSPEGRCKVFDASANGYVRSEGGAVFFLKPLSSAEKDGDPIQAVILGTGVNTDGGDMSLTVPDGTAQKSLLDKVYADAGIKPEQIHYVEAHGTGTQVGDPIEAYSIGQGIGVKRQPGNPLMIGSVKSNIGHLEPASGAAGLMKVILSLKHRCVPASIHFETPNPNIDFNALNLRLVTDNFSFDDYPGQLVMGVNSFGFGGSNAHAVIAEYKGKETDSGERLELPPLFLSAKSQESLKKRAGQFYQLISDTQFSRDTYDIFYTAALHRQRLKRRLVAYGKNLDEISLGIKKFSEGKETDNIVSLDEVDQGNKMALVFSGNGSQWLGMGCGLMDIPEFRETIKEIDSFFRPLSGWSIEDEMKAEEPESRLEYTEVAQPLLFAIQLGIVKLLNSNEIDVSAVIGHSVGEVAAAYTAGILDLQQAVKVIYYRSEAQAKTKGRGKMAAVQVSHHRALELIRLINDGLELAAINSPKSVTFTGPERAIKKLKDILEDDRVFCRILDLDYPFHSRVMDDIKDSFLDSIGELKPKKGKNDFISTVTGARLSGKKLDGRYWWENLREPVLFGEAINALVNQGYGIFIEVGPHAVLKTYILECLREQKKHGRCIITLKRSAKNEKDLMTRSVFEAILSSNDFDLRHFYRNRGKVTSLPVYPWNKDNYKLKSTNESINKVSVHPLLGYHSNAVTGLWQNQLDLDILPYLREHMVDGIAVFPAAGFLEMALTASRHLFDRSHHEISSFEIRRPLVLEEGQTREIQFLLCAEDMSFSIRSRQRLSDQEWSVHVIGKLINHASECKLYPFDFKQFKLDADDRYSKEELYKISSQIGLQYGEYFQALDKVWVNKDTLVSKLDKNTGLSESENSYSIGPAILDSAFHTLFPAIINAAGIISDHDSPFLPVAVDKINYFHADMPVDICVCEIKNYTAHSITASFILLSESSRVIARLDNCFFKQLKLKSVHKDLPKYYQFKPVPKNHIDLYKISPLPSLDELEKGICTAVTNERILEDDVILNEQILPLFDALASSLAERALRELGAHVGEFTVDSLLHTSGIMSEHRQFVNNLLIILQEDGKATCNDGHWKLQLSNDSDESVAIWRSIIADYPGCLPETMATLNVGFNLVDLLTNNSLEDAVGKSISVQRNHFSSSRIAVEVVRSIVHYIVNDWPKNKRRLRVAEIMDSDLSISRQLTSVLSRDYCDIHILATDESIKVRAEQKFKAFPNVTVSLLDLSRDSLSLEFFEGEIDILISMNWMHKAEDIFKTFSQLSHIVASGGLLIFSEKRPNRLIDINCGLDPEWWLRDSEEDLPVSLLMEADDWLVALEKAEFKGGRTLTDAVSTNSFNYVIVANREIRSKAKEEVQIEKEHPWLLICKDEGQSKTLAETLQFELATMGIQANIGIVPGETRADTTDRKYLVNEQDYHQLLTDICKDHAVLEHIIYLNGLSLQSGVSNTNLIEGQTRCCMGVVNLLKAMETVLWDSSPKLWIVTNDNCKSYNPDEKITSPVLPNQSTLWGLGRVIRNEFPNLDCKLLDMQLGHNLQKLSHSLIEEISRADEEDEIILTHDSRKVMRLDVALPNVSSLTNRLNKTRSHLTFTVPGNMDNLIWKKVQEQSLGPDEVEIEVVATGLNFRDVMFASGLLPDEMLDKGYAGATLGLECSGIITRTGEDVSEYLPGDEVIAFAPSSFATHAVASIISVAPKPIHWSFEEAATIPTCFFTAYYSLGYLARLSEGESILIHGASGGVGLAAIQYARYCGAEIFATAGTEEKRLFLKQLGVEHVLNSRTLDFADEILEITEGKGVDVVLNHLAGEAIDKNFAVLKPFGRFLELGKRDFLENTHIGLRPFRNNIAYYGIDADQIISEQPELSRKLFREIMELFEHGDFRPLTHSIYPASDISSAFRLMHHSGHIGKIVVSIKDEIDQVVEEENTNQQLHLSEKASYLITGGTSGFGLATARWLADKGARQIILLGRRSIEEAGIQKDIDEISLSGTHITVRQCDVSDPVALQKVLRDIEESLPPLKGIVHAAMVLNDSTMRLLNEDSMTNVFLPKIQGAWNLHQLTINLELDFFILYSSATTFIGNPGQANYVAANHYLESLARYRKAQGLPALAIAWDAIMDSGYLARNEELRETFRKRIGIKGITTRQAFNAMEKAILSNMSEIAVMNANWPAMKRLLPIISSPSYENLTHAVSEDDIYENNMDIMDMIEGLSKEEVHILITDLLTDEIAKILQLPTEKVEQNRSIQDLGIDSLMAMELVTAIESRFSIEIPVMAMTDNSTVDSIAARITKMLTGETNLDQAPEKDAILVRSLAASHTEEFTEAEIDEFAREFSEDKSNTRRMIQ